MTYHRTFIVKAIAATNTKGIRVKIVDSENTYSKILPFNYIYISMADVAIAYIEKQGIHITGKSTHKDFTILIA